jgi:hypothetical protein
VSRCSEDDQLLMQRRGGLRRCRHARIVRRNLFREAVGDRGRREYLAEQEECLIDPMRFRSFSGAMIVGVPPPKWMWSTWTRRPSCFDTRSISQRSAQAYTCDGAVVARDRGVAPAKPAHRPAERDADRVTCWRDAESP